MVFGALTTDDIAARVFIDIALIVLVARLVGALFRRFRQPSVVGEIIAGILLGPTLLGWFPGQLPHKIFDPQVIPALKVLAQLGLIIFMFIVGLELDTSLIRGNERKAAVISVSSIILPFSLGILLAAKLHPNHLGPIAAKDFVAFAMFIGAAMSVTAFPVLARILTERGMHRTELGAVALACAAVDDILAWTLLAVVLAIVNASGPAKLVETIGYSAAFVTVMFVVVKPRLEYLAERFNRAGRLTPDLLAVVLIGVLTCSFITSKIGIHAIFGAFLFGVIMPRKNTFEFFHQILERLEQVSVLLLLPVFFIVTGLEVNVRALGRDGLTELPLILLVACIGKFAGAAAAARAQGIPNRRAGAIGILMNTRGLTELVILNIGKEAGVLDDKLFTMLVIMAIVTTVLTEPLLRLVYPLRVQAADVAEAERAALGIVDAFQVVVAIGDPDIDGSLVDVALDVIGDERPAQLILTQFSHSNRSMELGSGLVTELADVAFRLEKLHGLEMRAHDRGVPVVVRSQFSADIAADLVHQANAVEADILLVPVDLATALAADGKSAGNRGGDAEGGASADVALVAVSRLTAADRSLPVTAVLTGASGAAVFELGLRAAKSRNVALVLGTRSMNRRLARQVSDWRARARRLGVDCRVDAVDDATSWESLAARSSLVVIGDQAGAGLSPPAELATVPVDLAAPICLVRSPGGDEGRRLEHFLDKAEATAASGTSPGADR